MPRIRSDLAQAAPRTVSTRGSSTSYPRDSEAPETSVASFVRMSSVSILPPSLCETIALPCTRAAQAVVHTFCICQRCGRVWTLGFTIQVQPGVGLKLLPLGRLSAWRTSMVDLTSWLLPSRCLRFDQLWTCSTRHKSTR